MTTRTPTRSAGMTTARRGAFAAFALAAGACASAAPGPADVCRRVRLAMPDKPLADLIDRHSRVRPGPLRIGRLAMDPTRDAPQRQIDTGYRIVVGPASAQPDSVPPGWHVAQVVETTPVCPDSRTFRVMSVWDAAASGPAGGFRDALPNFHVRGARRA